MSILQQGLILAALAAFSPIAVQAAERQALRLFVADATAGHVSVVDAGSGRTLTRLAMPGPVQLKEGGSPAILYAAALDAGTVRVIRTGIDVTEHGDHGDLALAAARLAPVVIQAPKPGHLVVRRGRAVLFADGTGETLSFDENRAGGTAPLVIDQVIGGIAHHGLAVPLDGGVLVSIGTPGKTRPDGLQMHDRSGAPVGAVLRCQDLHGEAFVGSTLFIGCEDVLLQVDGAAGSVRTVRHAYRGLPNGWRANTLSSGPGVRALLGHSARGAFVFDPVAAVFHPVELGADVVATAVARDNGSAAVALTTDGRVARISVLTGTVTQTRDLLAPVDLAREHWTRRPRLSFAAGRIAVSDPRRGVVHLLDGETLAPVREVTLGGMPGPVVLVTASGHVH